MYTICRLFTPYSLFHSPSGAIAGIVLAIIACVIIAVAIAIVVAILVYKLRTGKWFKLRHKDEDKLTVDFEKSWLMDDEPVSRVRGGSFRRMFSLGKTNEPSLSIKTEAKKEEEMQEPSDEPDGAEVRNLYCIARNFKE